MRAGKLRHQIRIEQPANAQDAVTGEMVPGWTLFATVMADIQPLSVRDSIAAKAVQSEVAARIVIRYRAGILPSMRISYRSQNYKIEGVLPDAKSGLEYLTLAVSAGASDGS